VFVSFFFFFFHQTQGPPPTLESGCSVSGIAHTALTKHKPRPKLRGAFVLVSLFCVYGEILSITCVTSNNHRCKQHQNPCGHSLFLPATLQPFLLLFFSTKHLFPFIAGLSFFFERCVTFDSFGKRKEC
jgi:hypothetical protein